MSQEMRGEVVRLSAGTWIALATLLLTGAGFMGTALWHLSAAMSESREQMIKQLGNLETKIGVMEGNINANSRDIVRLYDLRKAQ